MSPYENVIVDNNFNEIVFSNRNRAYGAYMLRKKQKKYLLAAFIIAFLMVGSSAIVPFIFKGNTPHRDGIIILSGDTFDTTIMVTPPEPPKINLEPMANKFVPPTVVDSVDDTNLNLIIPMDEIIASTGSGELPTIINRAVEKDPVFDVEERPFVTVEIPATFNEGGIEEFNRWVLKNTKYPRIAEENGISGKVTVQFVVNSKGNVVDVTVLRGADPALDEEAVRVIKSSPKWTPPLQGGKAVKQLFSLPVHFKMQ